MSKAATVGGIDLFLYILYIPFYFRAKLWKSMAHPDKDSGTEQKDRFMQNFVKCCSLANGKDENSIQFVKDCVTYRSEVYGAIAPLLDLPSEDQWRRLGP